MNKPMGWSEYVLLPARERRVAMAEDILWHIENGLLVDNAGYAGVAYIEDEAVCASCAIGAAYAASIGFNPNEITGTGRYPKSLTAMRMAGFSHAEATYIENVFEDDECKFSRGLTRKERLVKVWSYVRDNGGRVPRFDES